MLLDSDEGSSFDSLDESSHHSLSQRNIENNSIKYSKQDYFTQVKSRVEEFLKHNFTSKLSIAGFVFLIVTCCAYYFFMITDLSSTFAETVYVSRYTKIYHTQITTILSCMNAVTLAKIRSLAKFNQTQLSETLKNCPESMSLSLIDFKKVN